MIFVNPFAFSQKSPLKASNFLLPGLVKNSDFKRFMTSSNKIGSIHYFPIVPASFYSYRLGFFCKQEIKFDKISKIPFRFRLGSVDQCDRLEGKIK